MLIFPLFYALTQGIDGVELAVENRWQEDTYIEGITPISCPPIHVGPFHVDPIHALLISPKIKHFIINSVPLEISRFLCLGNPLQGT